MKAYFINLDRSPDRLTHMAGTLAGLGISHVRIEAVDGRDLSEEEIARHYRPAPGDRPLDPGTVACFLSHRRAWQAVAEAPEAYGLILEDDVLFGENAASILDDTSWIPAGTRILRLETVRRHTIWDARPVATVAGRQIVRLRHIHLGCGAYILSRKTADELLEQTKYFEYSVDNVLFNPECPGFCGMEALQMTPALCVQNVLAPTAAKTVNLPSILQARRRERFARGPRRLLQKIGREYDKRRLILAGLVLDKSRGRKTARIPFR